MADDDDTDFTDDSALSTPLPDNDVSFFDPLRRVPVDALDQDPESNTWLLSAMSICAELESNSATPSPMHRRADARPDDVTDSDVIPRDVTDRDVMAHDVTRHGVLHDDVTDSSHNGADVAPPQPGMKLSATMEAIATRSRSATADSMSKVDIGGSEDYIYKAAEQMSMAQNCEANGQYSLAFDYYKQGVGILLAGVQGTFSLSSQLDSSSNRSDS